MKKAKSMMLGSALLAGILVFGLYGMGRAIASGGYDRDEDKRHESSYKNDRGYRVGKTDSKQHVQYEEECGSCHLAYPARLLPAQSWRKMMDGLQDHFGENAELDEKTRESLMQYLSDGSQWERGEYRKVLRNLGDNAPLRITQLPYFIKEHDEISAKMVEGNDKVGSFSRCDACHQNAEKGRFDEDDVVIPGYGRWDD